MLVTGPIRISFAIFYPVRRRSTGSIHKKAVAVPSCHGLFFLHSLTESVGEGVPQCLPEKPATPARKDSSAENIQSHRHILAMVLYSTPRHSGSGLPQDGEALFTAVYIDCAGYFLATFPHPYNLTGVSGADISILTRCAVEFSCGFVLPHFVASPHRSNVCFF